MIPIGLFHLKRFFWYGIKTQSLFYNSILEMPLLNILEPVNKKNQYMGLLGKKNLPQFLKKNYILLRNLIHRSSKSPITAHSKPNGRYPA